jgi:hypothetical protein
VLYAAGQPEVSALLIPKLALGHRLEPVQYVIPTLISILIISYSSGNRTQSLNKTSAKVCHGTWSWASFIHDTFLRTVFLCFIWTLLFHIPLRDKDVCSDSLCLCVVQYIAHTILQVKSVTTSGQLTALFRRAFLTHVTSPHRVTFSSGQRMSPGGGWEIQQKLRRQASSLHSAGVSQAAITTKVSGADCMLMNDRLERAWR